MNPEYDELLVLAETLGEVKSKTEKLETEFSTQARPLEAATNALSAALSGIKALQFHVLDNNLGALSARVEEMRKAVDEQVGVIALELKKADETNAEKAGQEAEALRSEIAALQAQLGTLGAQFSAQLERVEFSAKEEAKKLQLIPGPAGAAGASLNPRGAFIDGETYNRLDVVSWLGSSYIAAVDGVTEKPSKNSNQWQVLASRGSGGAGGAGDFGSLAGVAQINQGGTGQTTRAAGLNALLPSQTGNVQYVLLTDGAGTVSWGAQPVAGLPSQTGNSGELLTTDGTNASWSSTLTNPLSVGSNASSGDDSAFVALRAITSQTASGSHAFRDESTLNTTTGLKAYAAFDAIPVVSGGAAYDHVRGFQSRPNYSGSATIGEAVSFFSQLTLASGATTNAYGIRIDPSLGAGSNSFFAAVLINDVGNLSSTAGRVTPSSAYAIYSTSAVPSYFGGTIQSGGLVQGTRGKFTGLGTSYGQIVSTDTVGELLGNPNLTIINGVLTMAYSTAKVLASATNLQLESTSGTLLLRPSGSTALTLTAAQKAEFASTIKTGAPVGGTAAEWKLGTVASISPTSPNRTIEVDIGGTIYYIHAKTTNN